MEKFDIFKMDPKMKQEIKALKTTKELKAYFAAKNLEVHDSKLEAVRELCEKVSELDLQESELINGGCNPLDTCHMNFSDDTCHMNFSDDTCHMNFSDDTCHMNFSDDTCHMNFSETKGL